MKLFLILYFLSILDLMAQVSEPLELIFSLFSFGEAFWATRAILGFEFGWAVVNLFGEPKVIL